MMQKRIAVYPKTLYLLVACLLLASFACGPVPAATVFPTAGAIISATDTPNPTTTPTPTVTLPATETPLPTPTLTPLVAGLGQAVSGESFERPSFLFSVYGPYRIESGALVLEREADYIPPPDMWPTGGLYGIRPVAPGTTTIVLFKISGAIDFNIGYHTGAYGTDSLRRFNFNSASGQWHLYQGRSSTTSQTWNARQIRPDVWQVCALTRSANGDVDVRIWERGQPERAVEFHGSLGREWGELDLTLVIDFRFGTVWVDEVQEVQDR